MCSLFCALQWPSACSTEQSSTVLVDSRHVSAASKPLRSAPTEHHRSRLIFRNLPPTLTPDGFRTTLSSPSGLSNIKVTDTKLVPKRRFAFVGYKSADEAERVKDWFDGSFVFGGGKVKVEIVKDEVSGWLLAIWHGWDIRAETSRLCRCPRARSPESPKASTEPRRPTGRKTINRLLARQSGCRSSWM